MAATKTHGFKPGNQLWRLRKFTGRPKRYRTAQSLLNACIAYIQHVEDNPLYTSELVTYKGESFIEEVPKMRAMSIAGLTTWLNIGRSTWTDLYRKPGHEYHDICQWVEGVIYNQKLEGASAGLLNANIIAMELGLRNESKIVTGDAAGNDVPITNGAPAALTEKEIEVFRNKFKEDY